MDFSGTIESTAKQEADKVSKISLESLSGLVGFPVDYLKKELLLETDEVSLKDLRLHMLSFLEINFSH